MSKKNNKKVLMICTGGTIAMLHAIEGDASSPLVPAKWKELESHSPALKELTFDVDVQEMELIDSSDMNPDYWIDIAKKIRDCYAAYDGFVVLHGTDTMAYTATALSFLLENLSKPVIVTGSQLPLAKPRSDAAQNLVTALMFAASDGVPVIPEVCVFFNNKLLRGNRSRKTSSTQFEGFTSPNYDKLAEIGEHIKVDEKLIRKMPASDQGFFINEFLSSNVMLLDIFPGIDPQSLRQVFEIKGLKGVVLRTYGTGNAPTSSKFLKEIETAINRKNITIVNITQCTQGMVEMGLYGASVGLSRIGVVSGVDMTSEAALVKMMFLLGQGYEGDLFREQMQRDLRGEQSFNVFNFIYDDAETDEKVYKLKTQMIPAGIVREKIARASIRFDFRDSVKEDEIVKIAVFMNHPNVTADTSVDVPQCLGMIKDRTELLECTDKFKQLLVDTTRPLNLTVVSYGGDISWDGIVFSIYTDVD